VDKRGRIVVDATFDQASDFSEGLAPVRIGAKFGFIDKQGNIVIPAKYGFTEGFKKGLARINGAPAPGYIDKTARYVWHDSD
jgi:hypothetical protein